MTVQIGVVPISMRVGVAIFPEIGSQQVLLRVFLRDDRKFATMLRFHLLNFRKLFVFGFEGEYGLFDNLIESVMATFRFVPHFLLVLQL